MAENKKKPIHETKSGSIRAAIWENDGREGVFYTYTLERLYKAADGWRSANTFSHRDAANLSAASSMAAAWIAELVASQAAAGGAAAQPEDEKAAA